ncbi:MAG: serine/threonine-protein kinase, partial [Acidobacteriota bacterium]
LPKVIDHFAENGDQFLVMEHISGDDLSKRLETANKPFPLNWVMFWADQMLDALSYLHSHEPPIVHRDIKPQNLKLTDENHIVLLDFGLSKDFDTNSASSPINSASVAGYSPHFASMEQIRGTGTDARSDIYSLSATLYQLLANVIPPDALTRADALLGGAKDPVIPINEINADVTPAISEVILKGLALRQDERYSTAAEMQRSLRRAFNKEKADADEKTVRMKPDGQPSEPEVLKEISETSEMETRVRADEAVPPMDETLQMDSPVLAVPLKQADIKTEIISTPGNVEEPKTPEPAVVVAEEPSAEPLVAAAAAASVPASPLHAQAPIPPAPVPAQVAVPTQKAKSKVGLVIGILLGLLVLGGIVGGGGWYAYTKYSAAAKPVETPSPSPETSVSPTPSPTVMAETNTNANSNTTDLSNSNTAIPDQDQNDNTTGPLTTKSVPQTPTKNAPAKTTQVPTTKTPPKTKAKDDRTVILQ